MYIAFPDSEGDVSSVPLRFVGHAGKWLVWLVSSVIAGGGERTEFDRGTWYLRHFHSVSTSLRHALFLHSDAYSAGGEGRLRIENTLGVV